jgi:hypothetical protein
MDQVFEKRLMMQFSYVTQTRGTSVPPSLNPTSIVVEYSPSKVKTGVEETDEFKPAMLVFDSMSPSTACHLQRHTTETDAVKADGNQENLQKIKGWTRDMFSQASDSQSPHKDIYSDRFIPMRQGNNWDTKFAMISVSLNACHEIE